MDFREFFIVLPTRLPQFQSPDRPLKVGLSPHRTTNTDTQAPPPLYTLKVSVFLLSNARIYQHNPPTNKEHCSIFLTIAHYIKWLRLGTIWSEGDPSAKATSLRSMAKRRREKALLFQTKMFNARISEAKLAKRDSSAVAKASYFLFFTSRKLDQTTNFTHYSSSFHPQIYFGFNSSFLPRENTNEFIRFKDEKE